MNWPDLSGYTHRVMPGYADQGGFQIRVMQGYADQGVFHIRVMLTMCYTDHCYAAQVLQPQRVNINQQPVEQLDCLTSSSC